jgi:fused signal recognition particle receptor
MEIVAIELAAAVAAAGGVAWWALRARLRRSSPAAGGPPDADRTGVPSRPGIRDALGATGKRFRAQLRAALGGPKSDVLERLEEVLLGADVGARTTTVLIGRLRERADVSAGAGAVERALREEMRALLEVGGAPAIRESPWVVLVTGVNGVGKTTTIGKLAALHRAAGRKVLVVAADTFRAAAIDQLAVWADRAGAEIVRHGPGADPSAVTYDGVRAAVARRADVVLVDTAGRLHTRSPLMDELRKVRRTIERELPGAPHEALLVVDATTGQNAVSQARSFVEAAGVTGVVVTKLDGTAKGGVVLAIRQDLGLPVRYVGVGEGLDDLRPFDPDEFIEGLLEAGTDD